MPEKKVQKKGRNYQIIIGSKEILEKEGYSPIKVILAKKSSQQQEEKKEREQRK